MSSNFKPAEGERYPGILPVISGVIYPMVASMQMRPCLISTERLRLKAATSPSAESPRGSQKPTGSCTPNSLSKAFTETIFRCPCFAPAGRADKSAMAAVAASAPAMAPQAT